MSHLRSCVQRGAALLDEKYPGWAEIIDDEDLEMKDSTNCVLGQIGQALGLSLGCHLDDEGLLRASKGSWISGWPYRVMLEQLDDVGYWPETESVEHGFTVWGENGTEWAVLEREWRTAIRARR